MSLPRRAMQESGFQLCCLLCDAPDTAGSARCRACIDTHRGIRQRVEALPVESEIRQFAVELSAMLAHPERHDADPIHGSVLEAYQGLLATMEGPRPQPTAEEVAQLFAAAAAADKGSTIRDLANRNTGFERPLTPEEARAISEAVAPAADAHAGQRTVPSRPIETIDRSSRTGEDRRTTDQVAAAAQAAELAADAASRETQRKLLLAERELARRVWQDELDEVDELLDLE